MRTLVRALNAPRPNLSSAARSFRSGQAPLVHRVFSSSGEKLYTTNESLARELAGKNYREVAPGQTVESSYFLDKCYWAGSTKWVSEVVLGSHPVYKDCLFLDRQFQSSSSDEHIYHEMLVQPVMSATRHIPKKRVLVAGGGEGATTREVLRWSEESVQSCLWADIDGGLVDVCRDVLKWAPEETYTDPRLEFRADDISNIFNDPNVESFDVIILDLIDPEVRLSPQKEDTGMGYLYSPSFWKDLMGILKPGGAVVSHTGPVEPGPGRQPGLDFVAEQAAAVNLGDVQGSPDLPVGYGYHAIVPSFLSEWGFWMSKAPNHDPIDPRMCQTEEFKAWDPDTQKLVFAWGRYWARGERNE